MGGMTIAEFLLPGILGIALWTITALALAFSAIARASTTYYNDQRHRIIMRLPEEPKPWYVRVFEKVATS